MDQSPVKTLALGQTNSQKTDLNQNTQGDKPVNSDDQDKNDEPTNSDPSLGIPVFYNVPKNLLKFSGTIPIGFGVPFAKGAFTTDTKVQVINENQEIKNAHIEINALYPEDQTKVKWIFVETIVNFEQGQGEEIYLQIGQGQTIELNPIVFQKNFPSHQLSLAQTKGYFSLETSNGLHQANQNNVILEKQNSLYDQYKVTGDFGATPIGEYVTRYKIYKTLPLTKITHSFTWNQMNNIYLKKILFEAEPLSATDDINMGIDEVSVGGAGDFYLYQKNYDQVTGSTLGEKLDGWINLNSQLNSRTISWRYPWQNYPNGIAVNNHKAQIELYSLEKSSIFSPNEIAATTEIASFTSEIWDIPTGTFGGIQLSPAGVSKTYELSVWEGQQVLPKVANQLLQNPVYAYIDPNFAVQSDFPHPMTSKTDNSILEGALSSAFDWVSNIRDPASRYGFWNFGEVPYDWRKKNMGSPTYRYWANHGTSWGTSAWSLWMRSGERKYIVNGETHARHAMDLDICKVPNWLPDNSKKRRGGLNVYSPLPGSYVGGRVVGKVGGYEYLSYIFYLTNYDRAFDITNLITESLIKFDHNEYLEPIIQNPLLANREFYRPLADIVTSYEATLNENLKNIAFQYLDLIELAQNDSGWFPGIKSPHYLTAGLNLAYRALPERKVQIQSILEKMITYRGNSLHPAKSGNVEGSFSLFSYYHLAKENMNTDLEDFISKRARSQYSGLYQLNNEWNGISAFPRFKYEFLIQDWLMSSKIMEEKGNDQTFLPASHVNGNLNGVSKHISYFKLEKNNLVNLDFSLHFQLSAGINQNHNIVMKVYNPKGALIHQKNYYVVPPVYQNPGIQFFKDQIQNITTTGVYKIEFELPAKPVGVNIQMNHKLVHEINPESFYIISVSEGAGSFYAKVLNNSTASVEVDYSSYSGKNLVRDMNQNILCESILFNILENAVEQSQICEFTNNGVEPVEILTNVSRLDNDTKLTNFYPYISLHPDQWFDPNE